MTVSLLNTAVGLLLLVRSINALRSGEALLIRNLLATWSILMLLLLTEECWALANGFLTRLVVAIIFLGDDGSLACWLVERSVAPRLEQVQKVIQRLVHQWAGPIRAWTLYYISWFIHQWNRLTGQYPKAFSTKSIIEYDLGKGDIIKENKLE